MKRYFAIILFVAALASCTPKLYDAQVEVPENYRFAGDFPQDSVSLPFAWWEIFGDSTLNRLVEHALENNRNLAQAASRIFEARANIAVARAPFLPSVGLNVSAQGNYTEPTGTTQQYTIEPSISWEVPLFGTLRSANRAAKAALYSSEWGYRGVMLSLTAEVATSYFTVLQYTRDLRIARQSYVLRRESAALVDSLARYGMSNGVALQQAMSLVYQAEADIPQYQEIPSIELETIPPAPVSVIDGKRLLRASPTFAAASSMLNEASMMSGRRSSNSEGSPTGISIT